MQRMIALDRHRLLEPVNLAGILQAAAQPDRGWHVEAPVRVDQNFNVRAGDLADTRGESNCNLLALLAHAAIKINVISGADAVQMRERIELQRRVA